MYRGKKETQVPLRRGHNPVYTKGGKSGGAQKRAVVALVERNGETRAVAMMGRMVTAKNVRRVLVKHADRKSRLHTDRSTLYSAVGTEIAKHEKVNHARNEPARGDKTTNSAEGFFGVFKAASLACISTMANSISVVIWTNRPPAITTGSCRAWTIPRAPSTP